MGLFKRSYKYLTEKEIQMGLIKKDNKYLTKKEIKVAKDTLKKVNVGYFFSKDKGDKTDQEFAEQSLGWLESEVNLFNQNLNGVVCVNIRATTFEDKTFLLALDAACTREGEIELDIIAEQLIEEFSTIPRTVCTLKTTENMATEVPGKFISAFHLVISLEDADDYSEGEFCNWLIGCLTSINTVSDNLKSKV